jgi:hypothetical protein
MQQLLARTPELGQIPDRRLRTNSSGGTLYVRSRTMKTEFFALNPGG